MQRRDFLRLSAGVGTLLALPGLSLRFAHASGFQQHGAVLSIFLRGGADALAWLPPHDDADLYRLRPGLTSPRPGIDSNSVLDLDGFFGLHPALAPLLGLYQSGHLALVHACGAAHGSRSHFDAQDLIERGADSKLGVSSGWLGRAAEGLPGAGSDPFLAAAFGQAVPRTLASSVPAMGISELEGFDLRLREDHRELARNALHSAYAGSSRLDQTGLQALEAIEVLRAADPLQHASHPNADYPNTPFANGLRQVAQLLKSDLGLRTATLDLGGWDHHQGLMQALPPLLDQLARGLLAFHTDLGPLSDRVTVVVLSEFGRRAAQNGSEGTDHGSAGAMMLLGGGVRGGKVYADWPGLADQDLDRGDLRSTIDYRQVVGEAVAARLPEAQLDHVLGDYAWTGNRLSLY